MPYASFSEVAILYGGDMTGLDDKVSYLLARAGDRIDQRRDIPARIAAGHTTAGLVGQVAAEMVAAVLRNPDAYRYTQNTETTGPYTSSETRTLDAAAASGMLRLTKAHRSLLGDAAGAMTVAPGAATMGLRASGHGFPGYAEHLA